MPPCQRRRRQVWQLHPNHLELSLITHLRMPLPDLPSRHMATHLPLQFTLRCLPALSRLPSQNLVQLLPSPLTARLASPWEWVRLLSEARTPWVLWTTLWTP